MLSSTSKVCQKDQNKTGKSCSPISSHKLPIYSQKCWLSTLIRGTQLKNAWLTLTLTDFMTRSRKLSARKDSTGDGTTSNPQRTYCRTWFMKKAYTIIPRQLSQWLKSLSETWNNSHMVRNTSSTNDDSFAVMRIINRTFWISFSFDATPLRIFISFLLFSAFQMFFTVILLWIDYMFWLNPTLILVNLIAFLIETDTSHVFNNCLNFLLFFSWSLPSLQTANYFIFPLWLFLIRPDTIHFLLETSICLFDSFDSVLSYQLLSLRSHESNWFWSEVSLGVQIFLELFHYN